jgi:hypothetical protein
MIQLTRIGGESEDIVWREITSKKLSPAMFAEFERNFSKAMES